MLRHRKTFVFDILKTKAMSLEATNASVKKNNFAEAPEFIRGGASAKVKQKHSWTSNDIAFVLRMSDRSRKGKPCNL